MKPAWVALALLVAGCHHAAKPGAAEPPVPATTVKVENQSFFDVDVFVIQHGMSIRLGRAASLKTEVFTIPANFVTNSTELQFNLRPIGAAGAAATQRTQTTSVQPGDQVVLMIPPS
jgi:hypothetical protein